MISPFLGRFFLVSKRTFFFFGEVLSWVLHVGRTRHPGLGPRFFTPGQLSIEFADVDGWLTSGDFALDSCAQLLAVAEHRFIPSRARSICHRFGLLPVRIVLLVVMLELVLSFHLVLHYLSHLLSLLSFRSFSGWVEF